MQYDFSQEIPRTGTNAIKWSVMQDEANPLRWKPTDEFFGENRILPLWVADMDFACPKPVVEALVARAHHGIYGYTDRTSSYNDAVVNWMRKRHGWEIAPQWICTTPGVVPALNMLVRTFIAPGERVLIQPPVYYPFFSAIKNNGGVIAASNLIYENGSYRMDFTGLEDIAEDPQVKMAILCSPHNPVGRVWTTDELTRFGEICRRNNVLIVSDEIHGDLIYPGHKFIPFASLGQDFAQNAVICTAPSKTFNMAGLQTSNIIIASDTLRGKFERTLQSNGLFGIGTFGVVAVEAAYNHGEEWLEQVLKYLEGNLRYLQEYVSKHIPQINVVEPEGSYLVWLDCRQLGLDKNGLKQLMLNEARVYLEDGFVFGSEEEGFERINIACPRSILMEALERIRNAILQRCTQNRA
jgi:cystathionine beta-lyase